VVACGGLLIVLLSILLLILFFLLMFNCFHHNSFVMGRLYRITPGELLRHGAKDLGFVKDFVMRMRIRGALVRGAGSTLQS
jgi:hypothetical protein